MTRVLPRGRRTPLGRKLLLAVAAMLLAAAVIEGALWVFHPLPPEPAMRLHKYLPAWNAIGPAPRTIWFDPGPLPGVGSGIVENAFNSFGFLYAEERFRRVSADELRIAVVGGSTVECAALQPGKRWPAVLEALLQDALPARRVTVLNLGVSAQDTRAHLATACQHVTALDVDVCVFMIGTNDLGLATATGPPMLSPDDFLPPPRLSRLWKDLWRSTQIGRHALRVRRSPVPTRSEPYYEGQARFQASLPLRTEELRVTAEGLAHYARNVVSLAGICRAHRIAVLFTTQPSMFPEAPSAEELAAFWGCHTGDRALTAANFVAMLTALNEHLLATCSRHGVPCVDLAREVPKGLGWFYDQVHFNEAGARRVAQALVEPVRALLR
jgi:lysophospholipase L1-like esterase